MHKLIFKAKVLFIPCQSNNFRPKFLTSRFLLYYLTVVLILKIVGICFVFHLPKTFFFADLTKAVIIKMTNEKREELGLSQLVENQTLSQAALEKAQNMFDLDYFAHQSTTGLTPWYWFKKAGYTYQYAGENLAIGFLDSKEVVDAWENSPSHKENLLNPNYKEIGIAVLKGEFQGSETNIVVQLFGSQLKENAKTVVQKQEIKQTISPSPMAFVEAEKTETVEQTIPFDINNIIENENKQIESKKVAGTSEFEISNLKQENIRESRYFKFFKFMNLKYSDVLKEIIFYSIIFVLISLILNIFIKIKIQDKSLILKTIFLILLMLSFFIVDESLIFKFIPHNIII